MVHKAALAELEAFKDKRTLSAETHKKLQALQGDESDLVMWVGDDGSVVLKSILVSCPCSMSAIIY